MNDLWEDFEQVATSLEQQCTIFSARLCLAAAIHVKDLNWTSGYPREGGFVDALSRDILTSLVFPGL